MLFYRTSSKFKQLDSVQRFSKKGKNRDLIRIIIYIRLCISQKEDEVYLRISLSDPSKLTILSKSLILNLRKKYHPRCSLSSARLEYLSSASNPNEWNFLFSLNNTDVEVFKDINVPEFQVFAHTSKSLQNRYRIVMRSKIYCKIITGLALVKYSKKSHHKTRL